MALAAMAISPDFESPQVSPTLAFFRHLPDALTGINAKSLIVVDPSPVDATRLEGGNPFDWTFPYLMLFMTKSLLIMSNVFFDRSSRVRGHSIDIADYRALRPRTVSMRDIISLKVDAGKLVANPGAPPICAFDLAEEPPAAKAGFRPGEFQLRAAAAIAGDLRSIAPNNYTGGGWRNGVMQVQGANNDMFYFVVSSEGANPLLSGDKVAFAHVGTATVTGIDIARQHGSLAVFVHVDRDLDPEADGYRHPVRRVGP